jgi:hypothetical protein
MGAAQDILMLMIEIGSISNITFGLFWIPWFHIGAKWPERIHSDLGYKL